MPFISHKIGIRYKLELEPHFLIKNRLMAPLPLSNDMQETQFSIDKELYDSTLSVRDEMNLIAERLNKMDEHKSSVSEAVYFKVKSDYLAFYDKVKKNFEEKKKEIQSALQALYKGKKEQEEELKKHQEILEEAKFRNFLGEFSDKKFKEVESRENSEIKRYESLLSTLEANIKQYEELIGGPLPSVNIPEESPKPKTKIPLVDESVSVAKDKLDEEMSPLSKISISSSEEGYVLESEGDYFQNENLDEKVPESQDNTHALPAENLPKLKTKKIAPAPDLEELPTNKQSINKIKTEKPKTGLGFDDSISSILKSIPLEEDEKPEEASTEAFSHSEEVPEVPAEDVFDEDMEASISSTGKARLECLEGDTNAPEFELDENTSIGRSPSNDIVVKEPKFSRQHAAINKIDGNYVIVDLKSSNGIFVNGRKVEEVVLEDGDEIAIGNTKLLFHST